MRPTLTIAATLAVALLYTLWSGRPLWTDVALLAVLALAVRLTWRGWDVAAPRALRWPGLAFGLAFALAALFSGDPLTSWRAVLGVVGYGLVFAFIGNVRAGGVSRAALYRALVLTAHVLLAALVTNWLLDGARLWGYRLRYENTNSFALFNLLLFPALLAGELRGLVLTEAVWVAWLSASRAGAAGLMAGLVTLARGSILPRHRWALAGLGLALAVGLAGRGSLTVANGRDRMWALAARMWQASPLVGHGPSTYKSWWLDYLPGTDFHFGHAHNVVLNLAAETGVIGVAAGAWLAWSVLRALSRLSATAGTAGAGAGGPWALAGLAGTVALLIHSLFDVPTTAPYLTVAWLALVRLGLDDGP